MGDKDVINARHECASTVFTSNKAFDEWGNVLGDEVLAVAAPKGAVFGRH